MDFPRAIKVVQLSTGVAAKILNSRPKSYYSRAGTVQLTVANIETDAATGLPMVTVNFPTPLKDNNWVPFFSFTNYADSAIDVPFIQVVSVLNPSAAHFKVLLSADPTALSEKTWLNWSIAEVHNP